MASLTVEQMQFLASKGMSLDEAIEFARMFEKPRSANAERQARHRARRKASTVTDDVTCNVTNNADSNVTPSLSLPPNENNSNPPTHTHPDNTPVRKGRSLKASSPAKPEDVQDQTWADFLDLRKRKDAPVTPTAMDGMRREAGKAGWTLEAALAETVTQGWRGFKADWVKDRDKPQGRPLPNVGSDFLDHYLAKQASGARP